MGIVISAAILVIILLIVSFYATLDFVEHLHKGDERVVRQSKFTAIICFGIAVIILVVSGYLALFYHLL